MTRPGVELERRGDGAWIVERFGERVQRLGTTGLFAEETDVDDVRYWAITPEDLVRQIVYAIDQPWGVTIGDITVRATGEDYIL